MIFKKFVFDIEKFSYGIYLIQGYFYVFIRKLYFTMSFILFFSYFNFDYYKFQYIFEKIPYINKVIGAK